MSKSSRLKCFYAGHGNKLLWFERRTLKDDFYECDTIWTPDRRCLNDLSIALHNRLMDEATLPKISNEYFFVVNRFSFVLALIQFSDFFITFPT